MVKNACSTLVALFAEVSRNGMPSWSANSCKHASVHSHSKTQMKATHLCNRIFDNLLGCQIRLVTNEELVDSLRGISVNLLQPLLNIGECVYRRCVSRRLMCRMLHTCVCYVVDDNNTVSASIIRGGDGSEPFLPCSVPLSTNKESQRYVERQRPQAGRTKGNMDVNEPRICGI
jgi:hypothetical protein